MISGTAGCRHQTGTRNRQPQCPDNAGLQSRFPACGQSAEIPRAEFAQWLRAASAPGWNCSSRQPGAAGNESRADAFGI